MKDFSCKKSSVILVSRRNDGYIGSTVGNHHVVLLLGGISQHEKVRGATRTRNLEKREENDIHV